MCVQTHTHTHTNTQCACVCHTNNGPCPTAHARPRPSRGGGTDQDVGLAGGEGKKFLVEVDALAVPRHHPSVRRLMYWCVCLRETEGGREWRGEKERGIEKIYQVMRLGGKIQLAPSSTYPSPQPHPINQFQSPRRRQILPPCAVTTRALLYEKSFNSKLSGNEVYYTIFNIGSKDHAV